MNNMMQGQLPPGHPMSGHQMQQVQPGHQLPPGHPMQQGQQGHLVQGQQGHLMQPGQPGHPMQPGQPGHSMQLGQQGHQMLPGQPGGHLMQQPGMPGGHPGLQQGGPGSHLMQHPGQQQQPQQQQQQQPSPDQIDSVTKFKLLIPQLKDSLQKVMSDAAQVFSQNSQIDNCSKSTESPSLRFDKNLEKFYATCDQIELNLKLSIEILNQSLETRKHLPVPVQEHAQPIAQGDQLIAYPQYINAVKMQLAGAKEIHDLLAECAKNISERSFQPPSV